MTRAAVDQIFGSALFNLPHMSKRNNAVVYNVSVVVLFLLTGAITLGLQEHWSAVDSMWFASVTLCTIGYGDVTPKSPNGRLFCSFYQLAGLLVVGLALSNLLKELSKRRVAMMCTTQRSLMVSRVLGLTPARRSSADDRGSVESAPLHAFPLQAFVGGGDDHPDAVSTLQHGEASVADMQGWWAAKSSRVVPLKASLEPDSHHAQARLCSISSGAIGDVNADDDTSHRRNSTVVPVTGETDQGPTTSTSSTTTSAGAVGKSTSTLQAPSSLLLSSTSGGVAGSQTPVPSASALAASGGGGFEQKDGGSGDMRPPNGVAPVRINFPTGSRWSWHRFKTWVLTAEASWTRNQRLTAAIVGIVVVMCAMAVVMAVAEGWRFLDALYFTVVTMT